MKRISTLLLMCTLLAATAAQADVYRCSSGRKVPVYANIACGPDAVRLDLPGIPIMVRNPDEPPPRRGSSHTRAPRPIATQTASDAAQIRAWAKASRDRLPASLGGKPTKAKSTVVRPSTADASTDTACSKARDALSHAEQRAWDSGKRLAFDVARRMNDAIFDACY